MNLTRMRKFNWSSTIESTSRIIDIYMPNFDQGVIDAIMNNNSGN